MRIVISGTVGVGKSTVSQLLEKKLKKLGYKVNFIQEGTVESIYLNYYYQSPQNWAFIAQLDFLLERFKSYLTNEKRLSNLESKALKNEITIYDRHFIDDFVFAELNVIKKNISMFNSLTYQAIYKEMLDKMQRFNSTPDFFILLQAPIETIMNRVKKRGRKVEIETNDAYWKDLYYNYYQRPMFQNHFQLNSKKVVNIGTENKKPEEIVAEIIKLLKLKKKK